MEGEQNVDELSKERSAKLVKTRAYMATRYAHVTLARDHVQLRSTNHQNHPFSAQKGPPHHNIFFKKKGIKKRNKKRR